VADEKYLNVLGFTDSPRLYPNDIWRNTSLPVIVTYVMEGQESQAVGLINNVGRVLPNNTILVYNLGLGNYGLKTLLTYCNNSRCQSLTFSLADFPSHVDEESIRAYRPLVIQVEKNTITISICAIDCVRRTPSNAPVPFYSSSATTDSPAT
jgi:hypothetical protein